MGHQVHLDELKDQLNLSIGERKIGIHNGDLLSLKAEALVCPVNPTLDFRTGLAKVVSQAAGKSIHKERPLVPEPFGKVVVLPGGKLNVKYIFLTVLYGEKGTEKIRMSIRQGVDRAIRYAEFLRLKSIAFPVLGDPEAKPDYNFVAQEMLQDAMLYFQRRNTKLKVILFSAYNPQAYEALKKEARQLTED